MNIVLIGYRGTGKTSVGKLLARKLNRKMLSTDKMIVKKADISINKIVKKYGWEKFRYLESKAIKSINGLDGFVIDAGGGVILKNENIKSLKKNGIIVLLRANPKVIVSRIKNSKKRPSLTNKTFIEEINHVLKRRKRKYNKAADFVVDTTISNIEQVCNEIIKKLNNKV